MKPGVAILLLLALLAFNPAGAQELKPFVKGSMQRLVDARQGKPFILGFWSLSCPPCRDELAALGELARKYPRLDLVLVSTDMDASDAVVAVLKQAGLQRADAWVFADEFTDRLRFEADKKWRGELPRTYLYDPAHRVDAYSGKLDPALLEQWIRMHYAAI